MELGLESRAASWHGFVPDQKAPNLLKNPVAKGLWSIIATSLLLAIS